MALISVSQLKNRCNRVDAAETVDHNELFRLLPQSHREAFLGMLREPESEQAKELVKAAAETGAPSVLPWWERRDLDAAHGDEDEPPASAEEPAMVDDGVLDGITPPPGTGLKLVYNVVAVA